MTIERWTLPIAPTRPEQFIPKRLGRARKLLGFLRLHRHALFDDALIVFEHIFDRVFERDDVFFEIGVDVFDHRGEGGGLAATGGPGE